MLFSNLQFSRIFAQTNISLPIQHKGMFVWRNWISSFDNEVKCLRNQVLGSNRFNIWKSFAHEKKHKHKSSTWWPFLPTIEQQNYLKSAFLGPQDCRTDSDILNWLATTMKSWTFDWNPGCLVGSEINCPNLPFCFSSSSSSVGQEHQKPVVQFMLQTLNLNISCSQS